MDTQQRSKSCSSDVSSKSQFSHRESERPPWRRQHGSWICRRVSHMGSQRGHSTNRKGLLQAFEEEPSLRAPRTGMKRNPVWLNHRTVQQLRQPVSFFQLRVLQSTDCPFLRRNVVFFHSASFLGVLQPRGGGSRRRGEEGCTRGPLAPPPAIPGRSRPEVPRGERVERASGDWFRARVGGARRSGL